MTIYRKIVVFFREHLAQILGGVFAAVAIEFSLRAVHPPVSLSEEAIFAGSATVLGICTGFIFDYLIEIRRLSLKPLLKVYPDQSRADLDSLSFILRESPRKAKLLEYSSVTVRGVVSCLVKTDTDIRLLLQHPSYAVSTEQCRRICTQIQGYYLESGEYEHLRIRCYKERASVRGHKFDDKLIHIGWYRYQATKAGNQQIAEEICGHDNPLLGITSESKEAFRHFSDWFDNVFEKCWNRASSLTTVCAECPEFKALEIPQDWINRISKE